jgi:nucleotide-binding universal stress UspA family protein
MLPIRTILHPTDFSESSDHAFQMACALARDHGASLVVLHVYPLPIAHGEVVARRQENNGYYDELWQKLHGYEAQNLATAVIHRLEEGDAATEILSVADELQCDLIVVGTHGRTGVGRLLMGSVAEQVMRKAPCPVLAVKRRSALVEVASETAAGPPPPRPHLCEPLGDKTRPVSQSR